MPRLALAYAMLDDNRGNLRVTGMLYSTYLVPFNREGMRIDLLQLCRQNVCFAFRHLRRSRLSYVPGFFLTEEFDQRAKQPPLLLGKATEHHHHHSSSAAAPVTPHAPY